MLQACAMKTTIFKNDLNFFMWGPVGDVNSKVVLIVAKLSYIEINWDWQYVVFYYMMFFIVDQS